MRNVLGRAVCLAIGAAMAAGACGDNIVPVGPPLAKSDVLFFGAHPDDDLIFMEPDLHQLLAAGAATTTIYATTTGSDGKGPDHSLLVGAQHAYGDAAGSMEWECGVIDIGPITAQHCRLRDRPVSLVDLALPDGGIPGDVQPASLLHLVDGTVDHLAGWYGGGVDLDTVVDLFVDVFQATTPTSLQTLDVSGSHGYDNSSHLFVGAIGLWAEARIGYAGPVTWNRGYNTDSEAATLDAGDLAIDRDMLGYFEACAYQCGPCGTSCPTVRADHETWLEDQYAVVRVPSYAGTLAQNGQCLDATLALGDCATAAQFTLSVSGALEVAGQCVTTAADDSVALAPCTGAPEQYWVLDSEGALWNGRPPARAADMTYDHTRCLAGSTAPTCGLTFAAHWQLSQ